jgi:hypothetical protein
MYNTIEYHLKKRWQSFRKKLYEQIEEARRLEEIIKVNLKEFGYGE